MTACDCTAALPLGHRSSWFRSISLKPPGADLEGSPANGCLSSPNIHRCMLPIVARLLLAITDNSSLRALAPNFHPLFFMILYVFLLAKDGSRARHLKCWPWGDDEPPPEAGPRGCCTNGVQCTWLNHESWVYHCYDIYICVCDIIIWGPDVIWCYMMLYAYIRVFSHEKPKGCSALSVCRI